jgi:hypothetical protein
MGTWMWRIDCFLLQFFEILDFRDFEVSRFWIFGILDFRDFRFSRFWIFEILSFRDFGFSRFSYNAIICPPHCFHSNHSLVDFLLNYFLIDPIIKNPKNRSLTVPTNQPPTVGSVQAQKINRFPTAKKSLSLSMGIKIQLHLENHKYNMFNKLLIKLD